MRKIYLLLIICGLLVSCQLEDDSIIINPNFTLNENSALTNSIKNITQNNTSFDDFIDNTSKVKIELPYNIVVNQNIQYSMSVTNDYQNLFEILQATPVKDTLELVFPLNVSGIDHNVINVNSKNSFDQLLENLPESTAEDCLDINYPISILYFNSDNSFISNQSFTSDALLFNFLDNLDTSGIFYQLEYPIFATTSEQTDIFINSNQEFTNIYNNLSNFCFNPVQFTNVVSSTNPTDIQEFTNFLFSGFFSIENFIINSEANSQYAESQLNFTADGEIFETNTSIGNWEISLDDDALVFALDFNDIFYGGLSKEWYVMALNEENSQLSHVDEEGIISRLLLSKIF